MRRTLALLATFSAVGCLETTTYTLVVADASVDAGTPDAGPDDLPREDSGSTAPPSEDSSAPVDAGGDDVIVCPHVGPPVYDPSTLPTCGGDAGGVHCAPASDVPVGEQMDFAECPTGLCIPDVIIEAAGEYIPPTCASVGGAEGRCFNVVVPAVSEFEDLPQATCEPYEVCCPCVNPNSGASTGFCNFSCDPGP